MHQSRFFRSLLSYRERQITQVRGQNVVTETIFVQKTQCSCGFLSTSYIMPPMPPISGIAGPLLLSGLSAITASVVKNIAATDAAF